MQVCDKFSYLLPADNKVPLGGVVQMSLLEAVAKVGDSTGYLDLCLKNEHIKEAVAHSMLNIENCHVRITKKRLMLEADGFTSFRTFKRFDPGQLGPEQVALLINLANDGSKLQAKPKPNQQTNP